MACEGKQSVLCLILWINALFPYHCVCVRLETEGSLDNSGVFKCGTSATIICTIPTYKDTMTWSIDSNIIASCFSSDCKPESPFRYGNVEYKFDTDNGLFKMIIPRINYNISGRVIQCEDGSVAKDITLSVKVLPDQSSTKIIESVVNNVLTIEAVAGCVFPISEVNFLWYLDGKPESSTNVTKEPYICTNGPCGGNEAIMLSSILSVQDVDTDKGDYIQVRVIYNGTGKIDPVIMNSTRKYRIKERSKKSTSNNSTGLKVGLSVMGVLLFLILVIVLYYVHKKRQNQGNIFQRLRKCLPR